MVKDEEKNLRRCLESLKLLIDKSYTELIIVDTGSKDSTVDIAKEYTEKLYFHRWNNNFSEMRNITISYAKGEWIFIMDADEELKNPQELLDLLNDDRINRFNTIMLREKEAQKVSIPGHTINAELFNTSRLFKNDGDFKYIGAVHNQPLSKNPTFLAQDIILYHYGYDISDKELMEKKFKRTSELLKGEIAKEPENVYYRYQLSVSYSMHGDKKEAWDEIQKAYALIKDKSNKIKKTYSYVYNKYAVFGYAQGKYEDIINVCKEGIEVRTDYVDLYFFAAQAFEAIKHNEEAMEHYKKYLDLMDDFENSTFATDFSVVLHTAVVESQNYAHEKLAVDFMNNDNYDEAIKHAKLIKVNNNELISLLFNIYIKFQKYDEIKNYYITLEEDKKNYLSYILEERKNMLSVQDVENIEHSFSQLEDNYGLLNRIRIGIKENSSILNEGKDIQSLDFNNIPDYYGDVIYNLLKTGYPIYDILVDCYELRLNKFFNYMGDKYEDLTEIILAYLDENKEEANFNKIRINKALKRYIIAFNKLSDDKFSQIFKSYISDGTAYLSEVYSKRIIEEERIYDLKNEEEAFLIYMYKAEISKDSNESEYVKYLGKALKSFPEMKKGIEILLNELKEKQDFMNDELEKLKIQLKEKISIFIKQGDLQKAKVLIDEYKNMIVDDIDIYSMEATIFTIENKLDEAEQCLYRGLAIKQQNFDLMYNLAYLYEIKGEKELQLEFYKKALSSSYVDEIEKIIVNKICELKNNIEFKIDKRIVNNYQNVIKEIENGNKNNIVKSIRELIKNRKFVEVLTIFYYYLKHSRSCIGEMYYFAGNACCRLKSFEKSIKYHNIAIRLEPALSNFVDQNNISIDYNFDDENINCIGCRCTHSEIVNVSNQSVSESNKGVINPVRVWVKCKECDLVYGNPLPAEDSLNKYYSIIAKEKFGGIYGNIKERESFLFEMSNARLDNICKVTDKKTLLDIGTGIGFFVKSALDRGYDAYGLELTPEDCEYAKIHYGLDLIQRNFYSFTEDEQYDIVTMFEVIEHMRTPLKDLKRINKLVKMGGVFVIATPILDSEYAQETKEENAFWNVVTHLSYFTKDVLKKYLQSAGFEVIAITDSMEGMGRMDFYCRKVAELYGESS